MSTHGFIGSINQVLKKLRVEILEVVTDVTYLGNTTIGDSSADTVTFNAAWSQMADKAIPFYNASKVIQQDAANFNYDSTTKTLNVARVQLTPPTSVAGGASEFNGGIYIPAGTVTFNPNQTGDFHGTHLTQTTIAQNSAATIANASTVTIDGAPIAGANATLTNTYSVWVKAGVTFLQGDLILGGAGTRLGLNATPAATSARVLLNPNVSIAGSSTARVGALDVQAATVAFTGATAQTGNVYVANIEQATLTSATSGTIAAASSLRVAAAPLAGSGVTLTQTYAFWVDDGNSRFDGQVRLQGSAAFSDAGVTNGAIINYSTSDGVLTLAPVSTSGNTAVTIRTSIGGVAGDRVRIGASGTVAVNASPLSDTMFRVMPAGVAGSASVVTPAARTDSGITVAFTGATAQTGDVRIVSLGQVTLTNATAGTIAAAATLYVTGAPVAGSGVTLTASYAIQVAAGNFGLGAGVNFVLDTVTGTKIGTATTQKIGFWNATPITQPAVSTITNNVTAGGVDDTINDIGIDAVNAASRTDTRNAIYQLARKLKQVVDANRLMGLNG